jgi:hypothetical protein
MPTLMHDPVGLAESSVIVLCLVFYAWWFSPRQRRKRLRFQARDRVDMRRALTGPTEGTGVCAPVPSVSDEGNRS